MYLLEQLHKSLLLLDEGLALVWCKVDVIAAPLAGFFSMFEATGDLGTECPCTVFSALR